jgi:hypothetical protein
VFSAEDTIPSGPLAYDYPPDAEADHEFTWSLPAMASAQTVIVRMDYFTDKGDDFRYWVAKPCRRAQPADSAEDDPPRK